MQSEHDENPGTAGKHDARPAPYSHQDAYGRRSGASGDPPQGAAGPTHASPQHEHEYRRWRDEQGERMDSDYRQWRRDRFASDFDEWRAIRRAQAGLRTGSGGPITHEDRERDLRGTGAEPEHRPRETGSR